MDGGSVAKTVHVIQVHPVSLLNGGGFTAAHHFHAFPFRPVSYTHLDVYKRQGEGFLVVRTQQQEEERWFCSSHVLNSCRVVMGRRCV